MPFQIPRLRRLLVAAALLLSLVVAGVYFHRRHQSRDALKQIPSKMNIEIQQTAEGFKVSKSEQGRTLFTIEASKAVQFKMGGRAELHNVTITLYGRDASRYDKIYGDDFAYDPESGDVMAKGEVRIDLMANPEGLLKPDQSKPTGMKNPIHLVTRELIFNQKTGDAFTHAPVQLQMPQVTGSAQGVHYRAKDDLLILDSRVDLALTGSRDATLKAERGVITKTPRLVVLDSPRLTHGSGEMDARKATLYLREDDTVDHIVASDGVSAEIKGSAPLQARAAQAEFTMNRAQDGFSRAVFSGDVQLESKGERPSRVNAGRVLVDFATRNQVEKIHAEDNVKLAEFASAGEANTGKPVPGAATRIPAGGDGGSASTKSNGQQIEIASPAMDFAVAEGKRLARAETSSPASITVLPVPSDGSSTIVTAAKFVATFDDDNRLGTVHGAPDAKVVSTAPGQPERVSTSQQIDAAFRPTGGIDTVVQQGNVQYVDGERQARADRARYTPTDQMLELTGSPRVTDHGLTTTARIVRMNRGTGDATAEGNVKSTYSELHEQPNGALLAAASPIHVTARTMTAHRNTSLAVYSGNARLWQDANVVEAPTIEFDRDHRSVVAQGDGQPVSTVLVQMDKHGNASPVSITSKRLTYTDDEHRAHFDGGVTARGADVTVTAQHVDAYLVPRGQAAANPAARGQGQLDHLVAEGGVVVQEPARQATGDKLTYTSADDRFVLTGGSPSIFDAEHGKIRGDSLTFFRHDDRVLVEGRDSSPTVTQTRVAR